MLLLTEILVGVVAPKPAVPLPIPNTKSAASKAPDPPDPLKTASLKVTDTVELSAATLEELMVACPIADHPTPRKRQEKRGRICRLYTLNRPRVY